MNLKTISVVIPLYNKVLSIKRAVDSVLTQTYKDFEVIVINDGSTDGGEEIVRSIKDPRIRLFTQENAFQHAARNRGIKESRNEFIAFLDADDEWLPEHLADLHRLATKYPECGLYSTAYKLIEENGRSKLLKFYKIPKFPWEGIIPNYFRSSGHGWNPVWISAAAVWKPVFDKVGFFTENRKKGGDSEMWFRIALRYKIGFCNNITAIYHCEAENRTSKTYSIKDSNLLDESLEKAILSNEFNAEIKKSYLIQRLNKRNYDRVKSSLISGQKIEALFCMKKIKLSIYSLKYLLFIYLLLILPSNIYKLKQIPRKLFNSLISRLKTLNSW